MESIAKLLKPGGEVLIVVPNFESLERSLYGSQWPWLDVPVHFYHFGPATLSRMVASTGLRVEFVGASLAGHSEGPLPAWLPKGARMAVQAGLLALNGAASWAGKAKAVVLAARRPE
jgi:hypothetical protein